jgi:hypothetical protein
MASIHSQNASQHHTYAIHPTRAQSQLNQSVMDTRMQSDSTQVLPITPTGLATNSLKEADTDMISGQAHAARVKSLSVGQHVHDMQRTGSSQEA